MIVRGKYYVSGVQHDRAQYNDEVTVKVHFNAVCSHQQETENHKFFAFTPSGTICLTLTPEEPKRKAFSPDSIGMLTIPQRRMIPRALECGRFARSARRDLRITRFCYDASE